MSQTDKQIAATRDAKERADDAVKCAAMPWECGQLKQARQYAKASLACAAVASNLTAAAHARRAMDAVKRKGG